MKKIIGLDEIEGAKILSFEINDKELFLSTDKGLFMVQSDIQWIDDAYAESYISIPTTISDEQYDCYPELFFDNDDEYKAWEKAREAEEEKEQLENDIRLLEYTEKQVEQIKERIKKNENNA